MDFKDKIESLVEKITKDKGALAEFKKDPVKTVKKVGGDTLPKDLIEKVVAAIESKSDFDKVSDFLGKLKK